MDIPLKNLFYGFVDHFASFQLDKFDFFYGNTKSTTRVLNYFASLGEMFGFIAEFELGKMDLVWLPRDQDFSSKRDLWQIFMHMESENAVDFKISKDDELVKLAESNAELVIGFFYIYKREYDLWINKIRAKFKEVEKKVLIILSPIIEDDLKDYTDWYGIIKESQELELFYIKEPWNKMLKMEKKDLSE